LRSGGVEVFVEGDVKGGGDKRGEGGDVFTIFLSHAASRDLGEDDAATPPPPLPLGIALIPPGPALSAAKLMVWSVGALARLYADLRRLDLTRAYARLGLRRKGFRRAGWPVMDGTVRRVSPARRARNTCSAVPAFQSAFCGPDARARSYTLNPGPGFVTNFAAIRTPLRGPEGTRAVKVTR